MKQISKTKTTKSQATNAISTTRIISVIISEQETLLLSQYKEDSSWGSRARGSEAAALDLDISCALVFRKP